MTDDRSSWYRALFLVAALYDLALGVGFFLLYEPIFRAIGMPLPTHASYVHLAAAFVAVQGFGYWLVYRDPPGNVGIVQVGVVYKAAYSGMAGIYLLTGQLPSAFFAWFAIFDVLFLAAFVAFLRDVDRPRLTGSA